MLPALLAFLGLAAAPAIPVPNTSSGAIDHARSLWLLGCLAIVTGWLVAVAPWLAAIGLWFLIFWRGGDQALGAKPVAALLSWAGVGVTWWAARTVPQEIFIFLPWAWILAAWTQAGVMVWQRYGAGWRWVPAYTGCTQGSFVQVTPDKILILAPKERGRWVRSPSPEVQPYGWLGQRSLAAGLYVLTIPFCPWWALPGPLVGLYLTGPAWGACAALIPSLLWLLPLKWLPWAAGGLLVALGALLVPYTRAPSGHWLRLAALLPRGDTLDGARLRWLAVRVCWEDMHPGYRWLTGVGPGQTALATQRWAVRMQDREHVAPLGDLHVEPLQIWYEYGVLGVAAMVLLAYEVGGRFTWNDPWSAAALGGAIFACSTWAFRLAPLGALWLAIAAGVGR